MTKSTKKLPVMDKEMAPSCLLYRKSSIGVALIETLDEMITNGHISPLLGVKVLMQFDKSIANVIEEKVKAKAKFKANLHTYRYIDNLWTFVLENVFVKTDDEIYQVGVVKMVASDANVHLDKPQ